MRRAHLLALGIALIAWLEFEFFPGHSYLQSETQVYVPVLERLDSPGLLSRDLVATHPNVTYTIYDEVTLFLHAVFRVDFQAALTAQQILFRAGALWGIFLLVRSTGIDTLLSLIAATVVNLGATLYGPAVSVIEREPIPRGFALQLVLLGIGSFAAEKPLLAGLAGGLAFVYDARIAAFFWLVALAALIFDQRLRHMLRASVPIFAVFLLLLANLAQLQPGAGEMHGFFEKLSPSLASIQQFRTGHVWVSSWATQGIWHYLAIWTIGLWACARVWPSLNHQNRWFFLLLPTIGIATVPLSYGLLDVAQWSMIPQIQPARALVFVAVFTLVACVVAGMKAVEKAWYREALCWLTVMFSLPFTTRILDLLRVTDLSRLTQLALAMSLGALLTYLLKRYFEHGREGVALAVPVIAILVLHSYSFRSLSEIPGEDSITQVADWAERNTWGGSMFLFPDAGRERYPGLFRAKSKRAVWVDWQTGEESNLFETFAPEWFQRWKDTMVEQFSIEKMQRLISLPADYYVLKRANGLAAAQPAFATREFLVYDAHELRRSRSLVSTGVR
jgi:hypothetical protein